MKLVSLFTGWSIAARLVALALVPAFLMLIAVNVSLYAVAADEANADIKERGRLIAAALSEGSRYGVISGNAASVERTARGLMTADPSIASIEVLDAQGKPLVALQAHGVGPGAQVFEVPIGAGELDVNLFDPQTSGTSGEAANASGGNASGGAGHPVGQVRVVMSPEAILQAKRNRLYFGSAMVLLAAVLSAAVGLGLAKRLREPLDAVMAALRGIRQGRYQVQVGKPAGGEVGELQSTIVEMARGLEMTHQHLERQVAARTQELREAVETVRNADAEKRRLIARSNDLVEAELRRVSLEIHDDLNAVLVSVRLQAAALASIAAADGRSELQTSAARIAELIDGLYARARDIVQRLRPEVIDTLGLAGAIEEMARRYDEVDPACRFEFVADPSMPVIPDQIAIAAYRVVQEALSNVVKHSGASLCTVTAGALSDPPRVRVTVQDNGRGFDTGGSANHGLGLVGMRERVTGVGGSLFIESATGQGTLVTMILAL